jgi:DNA-binding transcriptional LysR family regulator
MTARLGPGLLEHVRTFVRAVETGSFTAVAAEQGQSQPTVSRRITALEEHLGARLLQRTTRALALTDEGRAYYEQAVALLDAADAAGAAVRPGAGAATGTLRVAAPLAFARLHVMPRLGRFLAAHPALRTDWVLGDRAVDLVEEGVDLAIRIGRVTDQALVARRIGETRRVTVATPAYWARVGQPVHPEDLHGHDCIVYTGLALWTSGTSRRRTDGAGRPGRRPCARQRFRGHARGGAGRPGRRRLPHLLFRGRGSRTAPWSACSTRSSPRPCRSRRLPLRAAWCRHGCGPSPTSWPRSSGMIRGSADGAGRPTRTHDRHGRCWHMRDRRRGMWDQSGAVLVGPAALPCEEITTCECREGRFDLRAPGPAFRR